MSLFHPYFGACGRVSRSFRQKLRHLKHRAQAFCGGNFFCNICLRAVNAFEPYGVPSRDCTCPWCGSDERTRHLFMHLLAHSHTFPGKKILHVAPEKQLMDFFKISKAEYFDCDLCNPQATYKEDLTRLSFHNAFFGYAVCMHVLEHIVDDEKAIYELFRVLKPGGGLFAAVPLHDKALEDYGVTNFDERKKMYGEGEHVRNYSHELFCSRLARAGFALSWSSPEALPENIRVKYNLGSSFGMSGSRIYICKK